MFKIETYNLLPEVISYQGIACGPLDLLESSASSYAASRQRQSSAQGGARVELRRATAITAVDARGAREIYAAPQQPPAPCCVVFNTANAFGILAMSRFPAGEHHRVTVGGASLRLPSKEAAPVRSWAY